VWYIRTYGLKYLELRFCRVLSACETWCLTLRDKQRLRVFENRVLKNICGPKEVEITGGGENWVMRIFIICTPGKILLD
jgi:hypothetical protein